MQAVPEDQAGSPEAKPTLKERADGPLSAALFFLTIAAVAPAFVHALYLVGRWSWQVFG